MNLSSTVRTVQNVITANSPVLLVGTAIAGVVTTGVLAARGGYKARGIIDFAEDQSDEPLTPMDKVKLTWLCYAIPAVTGASSIAAVVGVHTIHTKRHAALAGLYAVSAGKLDDLREEAENMLSPKKTQELNDRVGQKAVDKHPIDHEVIITGEGNQLMFDEFSGRYFMGSIPIVERACAEVNALLAQNGEACLNDYYDSVGEKPIPIGMQVGWNTKLYPTFGSTTTSDGRSAVSVSFQKSPKDMGGN